MVRYLAVAALALVLAGGAAATPPLPLPPPIQPPVSAEALALGQRLANRGEVHNLVGRMTHAEVERIAHGYRLAPEERQALEDVARRQIGAMRSQVHRDAAALLARSMTLEEMRAAIQFFESPSGRAYGAASAALWPEIEKTIGNGAEFRARLLGEYCRTTGKLCVGYLRAGDDTTRAGNCPVSRSRNWNAWVNAAPGPAPRPALIVIGEVEAPAGFTAELRPMFSQLIDPATHFEVTMVPAPGKAAGWREVRHEVRPAREDYHSIVIHCGGAVLQRIEKVDVAS
jgi:hypothetical protein